MLVLMFLGFGVLVGGAAGPRVNDTLALRDGPLKVVIPQTTASAAPPTTSSSSPPPTGEETATPAASGADPPPIELDVGGRGQDVSGQRLAELLRLRNRFFRL